MRSVRIAHVCATGATDAEQKHSHWGRASVWPLACPLPVRSPMYPGSPECREEDGPTGRQPCALVNRGWIWPFLTHPAGSVAGRASGPRGAWLPGWRSWEEGAGLTAQRWSGSHVPSLNSALCLCLKVCIVLCGERGLSEPRELCCPEKPLFERNSRHTFVLRYGTSICSLGGRWARAGWSSRDHDSTWTGWQSILPVCLKSLRLERLDLGGAPGVTIRCSRGPCVLCLGTCETHHAHSRVPKGPPVSLHLLTGPPP